MMRALAIRCPTFDDGWVVSDPTRSRAVEDACAVFGAVEGHQYCCEEATIRQLGLTVPTSPSMDDLIDQACDSGITDVIGTTVSSVVKTVTGRAVITGQKSEESRTPIALYAVGGVAAVGGLALLGWWLWKRGK